MPLHAQLAIDHRRVIPVGPHLAGADRMMRGARGCTDMRFELGVGGARRAGRDLAADE